MTQWTDQHGLTPDSKAPTLHLGYADFQSAADLAAFGDALQKYPDILPEIVTGAIDVGGVLTERARAFALVCANAKAEGEINPRVAEAIAHYGRWAAAGKPLDGVA